MFIDFFEANNWIEHTLYFDSCRETYEWNKHTWANSGV